MRRMRICFTDVFFCFLFVFLLFVFCFFPFATKIPDNRSRERLNGFSWNLYQMIAGKWSLHRCTQMGARPPESPINFLGAKNYTLCTWWWRLASDWELVCWLWHCAATAVVLKRHERVNAFNLVVVVVVVLSAFSPVLLTNVTIHWWSIEVCCFVIF